MRNGIRVLFVAVGLTIAAVPANETMPTRTSFGSSAMNDFAALCAALMRLGATSVARMLRETSIAKTIVCCCDGRVKTALGRAIATIATTSASRNSSGGTWRRIRWPGPIASLTSIRLA